MLASCLYLSSCSRNTPQDISRAVPTVPVTLPEPNHRHIAITFSPEQDEMFKVETQTLQSPNGNLFATTSRALDSAAAIYTNTLIVTESTRVLAKKEASNPMLKPLASFEPQTWSLDGMRLYVAESSGPGRCAAFQSASSIMRVDTKTGDVTQLDLPKNRYGFSISPDEQQVAYFENSSITLLSLGTSTTVTLPNDERLIANVTDVGSIRWNATSDAFAFSVAYAPCGSPDSYRVFLYSNAKGFIQILSSSQPYAVEGLEADRSVFLWSNDYLLWKYDLLTGKLTRA